MKKESKKESESEQANNSSSHKESGDEERVYRTMIRLDDFDAVISIFGIECLEKKMRFVERPTPRFQYGIAINGGMEPSIRYPKTDLYAWYERESVRDERYERLLVELCSLGIKVIQL